MKTIIDYDPIKNSKLQLLIEDEDRGKTIPVATCDIDKFSAAYNSLINLTDRTIIPAAMRWISGDGSVILWERPPHYITFQYSDVKQSSLKASGKALHTVRLPIPWQYYFISLSREGKVNNIFMFFGKEPIQDIRSHIMMTPPILNFYSNGRLCPAVYDDLVDYGNSYDEILNYVYTTIWYSGFNFDLYETLGTIRPGGRLYNVRNSAQKLYAAWSRLSLAQILAEPFQVSIDNLLGWATGAHLKVNSDGNMAPGEDIALALTIAAQDAESMV